MWADYEQEYSSAIHNEKFLAWREVGARQKALNIVRLCEQLRPESIVEIGCGTGAVLRWLQDMSFAKRYVCTDIAHTALQFAKNSCRDFLSGAFVASANDLPFGDRAFDLAILSHVVEHLQTPATAIREASRIARHVFVEVPIEKVLSNEIRTKLLRQPYPSIQGAGHLQFWSRASMQTFLLTQCGVEILSTHKDLLNSDVEMHGKSGLRKLKPFMKQALKKAIPSFVYCQLLTTHAAYLCKRAQ